MKLTKSQLDEVRNRASMYSEAYSTWRGGQSFFNALDDLYPEMANEIRASENDMFYNEKNIDIFIKKFVE